MKELKLWLEKFLFKDYNVDFVWIIIFNLHTFVVGNGDALRYNTL